MNDGSDSLFEVLEPPRGGLAGLRARIEREQRRRVRQRLVPVAVAASLALAMVGLTFFAPRRAADAPELDFGLARMRLGLVHEPSEPLTVPADLRTDLAARRVPLETDQVVFYLVASRAVERAAEGEADRVE